METERAVVITGCSSGIGWDLAVRLDALGYCTVATCRSRKDCDRLTAVLSNRAMVLQVDVNKDEDAVKLAEAVNKAFPHGLFALINNAGLAECAPAEAMPMETYRSMMNTNYIGMVAITKALLPALRRAKGRILQMSSMAGTIGGMSFAGYCATKFAIEGFSDGLRNELRPFGVKVVLIKPYYVKTPMIQDMLQHRDDVFDKAPEDVRRDYGADYTRRTRPGIAGPFEYAYSANVVVDAVVRTLRQSSPPARVIVGRMTKVLLLIHWLLPTFLSDLLLNYTQSPQGFWIVRLTALMFFVER